MDNQQLVIIRGLPGSGKSTYAKENYPNHLHYETDHIFYDAQGRYRFYPEIWEDVNKIVYKLVDYALARKEYVVVTDVFAKISEVEPYRKLAEYHGVDFKVVIREEQYKTIHHVPKTAVDAMRNNWEEF